MKKNITGVYIITNLINNKAYIGSSSLCVKSRISMHLSSLRLNKHCNIILQRSFNKYKEENFNFELLEEHSSEYCLSMEQYWINMLNTLSRNKGYNICPVAGSSKGRKHSAESILKMIESSKLNKHKRKHEKYSLKVSQFTLDGIHIKDYNSISEASKETNIYEEGISKVCKGIFYKTHNFKWEFTNKLIKNKFPVKIKKEPTKTKYNKTTTNKTFIKKYNNTVPEFNIFYLNLDNK